MADPWCESCEWSAYRVVKPLDGVSGSSVGQNKEDEKYGVDNS